MDKEIDLNDVELLSKLTNAAKKKAMVPGLNHLWRMVYENLAVAGDHLRSRILLNRVEEDPVKKDEYETT